MSIPTKREQGDIRLIDNLVGFCGDMETEDAWNRVKADIATRELAIAERDAALAKLERLELVELECEAQIRRAEAAEHAAVVLASEIVEAAARRRGAPPITSRANAAGIQSPAYGAY